MNSIRSRLTAGFVVVLGAGLTGFGILFHSAVSQWLVPDALAMAKDKTVRFGRWVNADAVAYDENLYTIIRNEAQGFYWAVMDSSGKLVQKSRFLPDFFPLPAAAWEDKYHVFDPYAELRRDTNGALHAVAWFPVFHITPERRAKITGWTMAVVPAQPLLDRKARLERWLVAGGVAALAIFSFLAYYLAGLWLRPWRGAAADAQRLGRGNLSDARLPVVSDDPDLARIVKSFNTLLDRLKESHARQQQFVADAAHELRTPLAALRAEIEVALRRQRSGGEYQQTLELNRLELERLGALVENLLTLARLEGKSTPLARAPVNLPALCRDVAEQLAPLAGAQGVRLNLDVPDELVVHGDAPGLESATRNLVENALRHTPSGEEIVIRAGAENGEARIAVIDRGVGIAPEHLSRIFDRFYRVDTARNRASGGAGLGLSIVKSIAEAHGGSVTVESKLGAGSTFTLRLPAGADGPTRRA